ncbi:MAG: response regulator [Herpetosiphonaceae bacterium]|nr:response regulator [Herpetosiphonaceae bacterium]
MTIEQSVHILLVDDRMENLLALEAILEPLGHHLVLAQSGAQALRALLKQDFAVILLDVQMPDMDGFETARLIRSRDRSQHTPIIFLTALDTSDTNVSKGYLVGAVDFMFKPFMPDVLRFKVAVFVELFKKTAEIQLHAAGLEDRVQARTADLMIANESLRAEIYERERAEQALRFLANATAALSASLEYDHTLQVITQLAVPYLADTCVVDIVADEQSPRHFVVAHADGERAEELRQQFTNFHFDWNRPHPVTAALRSGKTQLVSNIVEQGAELFASTTDQADLIKQFGFKSGICLPLLIRNDTIGTIALLYSVSGRTYTAADLPLLEEFGRRASLAIEQAYLYREAQQALRARDQFLSIASHELRTPITAILGYAQLVERRLERSNQLEPRNQQALRTMTDQAQRLDRLIRSLLDLSRIQTGQFSLDLGSVDLEELVRRTTETTQPTLTRHVLSVVANNEPVMVHGDEMRLAQVLQNLIQNAIKYSPEGGAITIRLSHDDDLAHLTVSDQGVGIPAESIPQLFNRFYRASNVEGSPISGMGVGLFVVKEIVMLHGGSVDVESIEGQGSDFTIHLPLYNDDSALLEHNVKSEISTFAQGVAE